MSHVAYDPKTHAPKSPLPSPARPQPSADRAQASAFDSLLDSAQPSDAPRQAPAEPDAAPRERSQPAHSAPSNKAKSTKSTDTKPSDSAKAGDDAKPVGDGTVDDKAAPAEAEKTEQIAATTVEGDKKATGNAKPADELIPTAPIGTPQVIAVADPVATVVTPAATPQVDAADPAAIVTAAGVSSATPDALAALQGKSGKAEEAGKGTEEEKFTVKTAAPQGEAKPEGKPEAKSEDKPQSHDADKDLIASARGEANAKDGRTGAPSPAANADNAAAPKADAVAPQILTAPAHAATAHAATAATAPQPAAQAAAIPLAHVAIEITNKALSGKNHFEIRLDPPELGRIEVRLDVDRDGNVTSRMIADRPDTLDLLRRDAAGLERALNDAGLKTSDNGLQFSLRDNSTGQQQAQGRADAAQLVVEDETLTANEAALLDYSRLAGQRGGLDIRV